jgi:RNA polymerase sigma-70 factor (ECF subfamily)
VSDHSSQFREVVAPHLGDAFGLARWLAGNDADAEDIVQEACLRAFRGMAGYNGLNARAWVLSIVRNTAYTWLSENRNRNVIAVDFNELEQNVETPDTEPTAEAALIEKVDAEELDAAIKSLPLEFREPLVLHDVQGLNYRSVASVMGIPLGTVMSRLARARQKLMVNLARRNYGTERPHVARPRLLR